MRAPGAGATARRAGPLRSADRRSRAAALLGVGFLLAALALLALGGTERAVLLIVGGDAAVVGAAVAPGHRRPGDVAARPADMTVALLAGLAYGVLVFGIVLSAVVFLLGHSQSIERLLFVAAILVVVPLSVTLAWRETVGKGRASSASALALAAVTRLGLGAAALCLVRILDSVLAGKLPTSLILCLALVTVAICPFETRMPRLEDRHHAALLAAVPLLLGLACLAFVPPAQLDATNVAVALASAIGVASLCLNVRAFRAGALGPTRGVPPGGATSTVLRACRRALELGVPLLLGLLVFFRSGPNLGLALEQNYFLGPTTDVLHGHAMLVGTFSQYGVGMFDALALLFSIVTIGYGKLTLLIAVLTALMYVTLYVVLRSSTRSVLIAATGAAVAATLNIFGSPTFYTWFPSTGVLRFGFPWLVLLFALRADTTDRRRRRTFKLLVFMTVAVAAMWSGEAGVYTLGTAVAMTVFDAALDRAPDVSALRVAGREAFRLLGVYIGSLLAFTVVTRVAAGTWPDWGYYIDYIRLYTIEGFGNLAIDAWSPGLALAAIYLLSAIALGLVAVIGPALRRDQRSALRVAAGLTAFGTLSFTYFLGRAAPDNLLHIAPPGVALVFVWLGLIRPTRLATAVRLGDVSLTSAAVAAFAAVMLVASQWSYIGSKLPDTALAGIFGGDNQYSTGLRELWDGAVVTPASSEVKRFARTLAVRSDDLTILTTPYVETETLLLLGAANAVGSSNPCQESFSTTAAARVRRSVAALAAGGIVIVSDDPSDAGMLLPIQKYTFRLLQVRFDLMPIGTDGTGLRAFLMTRRTTGSLAAVPVPAAVPVNGGICG